MMLPKLPDTDGSQEHPITKQSLGTYRFETSYYSKGHTIMHLLLIFEIDSISQIKTSNEFPCLKLSPQHLGDFFSSLPILFSLLLQ